MLHNYRSGYLVTIDNEQSSVNSIYEYEECKFEETFRLLKPSKVLPLRGPLTQSRIVGKSRTCRRTGLSVAWDCPDFDENAIIVRSDENDDP